MAAWQQAKNSLRRAGSRNAQSKFLREGRREEKSYDNSILKKAT